MIDILAGIISGEITDDSAYRLYDQIMDQFHHKMITNQPREELGLDKYEWTAFSFGANFNKLAEWRKYGWPKHCFSCNKQLNYKNFGWSVINGELICIDCFGKR